MLVQCDVRQVQCPVSGRRDPEAALVGHPMVGGCIAGGLSVAGGLATAALGAHSRARWLRRASLARAQRSAPIPEWRRHSRP